MQQFEADFRERLQAGDVEDLVKWVKEQVLQSYRNGLGARSERRERPAEPKSDAPSPRRSGYHSRHDEPAR